jgi:hypothetical protein
LESNYSSCTGGSSENIYVAAVEVRRSGKRKERMKLSLPSKLVKKLVWVLVILLCKISIHSYVFDALLCGAAVEVGAQEKRKRG